MWLVHGRECKVITILWVVGSTTSYLVKSQVLIFSGGMAVVTGFVVLSNHYFNLIEGIISELGHG
jgi:hypothetical protein